MNLFEMFEQGPPEPTLIDALRDFLPLAVKHLKLNHIPKIRLVKAIDSDNQPAFGRYSVDDQAIEVVVNNRNPADILRTLAHEMVHYTQGQRDELDSTSGETGSPIEDQANAEAGVIMRVFAQQYPRYLTLPAIEVPGQIDEKRKRKKKKKNKPVGGGGYYGYYWGDSNSNSSGDGGGGESMYEGIGRSALVAALSAALVAGPVQADTINPVAQAIGIARTVNNMKGYGKAGLEGEANQELMNILRAIQGHPNQSKLLPIIKDMIKSDENGTPPIDDRDLPPLTNPEDTRR